jgi:outer membrane protein assembly factor BamB
MPRWGVAQSVVLYGDSAILTPLSGTAGVVAVDKNTGGEKWRSPAVTNLAYVTPRIVKLAGVDQVVTISGNRLKPKDGSSRKRGGRGRRGRRGDWMKLVENRVIGVAADDGRLLWSYADWKCANAIPMPFPVGDDRILITGGYSAGTTMLKIDREGKKFGVSVAFRNAEFGSQIAYPVLHEDHIYMICNDNSARNGMVCMDLEGNLKWKTGNNPLLDRGHLLPAEGRIYTFDGKEGLLLLLDPNPTGYREIARKKMFSGPELWAPLVISHGRLFVRGPKVMSCLDISGR